MNVIVVVLVSVALLALLLQMAHHALMVGRGVYVPGADVKRMIDTVSSGQHKIVLAAKADGIVGEQVAVVIAADASESESRGGSLSGREGDNSEIKIRVERALAEIEIDGHLPDARHTAPGVLRASGFVLLLVALVIGLLGVLNS